MRGLPMHPPLLHDHGVMDRPGDGDTDWEKIHQVASALRCRTPSSMGSLGP